MRLYAVPFREASVRFCVLFLNICRRELDESSKCKPISTYLGTNWETNLEIDVRKGIVAKFPARLCKSMFKVSWQHCQGDGLTDIILNPRCTKESSCFILTRNWDLFQAFHVKNCIMSHFYTMNSKSRFWWMAVNWILPFSRNNLPPLIN